MRPLAVVALALVCAALLPGVAGAERWARPVPGDVARPFVLGADPFRAGQHRGADLEAPPGQAVRSACAGRVVFAGPVADKGRVVSVRCGRWRVSYLGLGELAVRAGVSVRARERLGRAAGREGLHFGVRREGARFGYVDPLPFLRSEPPTVPPPLAPVPRRVTRLPALAPPPVPVVAAPAAASPGLAPWPVWAGLALVLAGVAGSGYARRSGPRQRRLRPCPVSSTSSSSPTTPTGR